MPALCRVDDEYALPFRTMMMMTNMGMKMSSTAVSRKKKIDDEGFGGCCESPWRGRSGMLHHDLWIALFHAAAYFSSVSKVKRLMAA